MGDYTGEQTHAEKLEERLAALERRVFGQQAGATAPAETPEAPTEATAPADEAVPDETKGDN